MNRPSTASTGCPTCGARVRDDDTWCSLCYADLRPAPAPAPAPASAPGPAPAETDAPPAGWPCPACGAITPWHDDACGRCGERFLAALRDGDAPLLVLPVVGDVGGRLVAIGPRGRMAAGAAVLLLVSLLTALLAVLGR